MQLRRTGKPLVIMFPEKVSVMWFTLILWLQQILSSVTIFVSSLSTCGNSALFIPGTGHQHSLKCFEAAVALFSLFHIGPVLAGKPARKDSFSISLA